MKKKERDGRAKKKRGPLLGPEPLTAPHGGDFR